MPKKIPKTFEPVVTTELTIVDGKGNMRMHLSTWPTTGLPRLALYDGKLLERVVVALHKDGSPHFSLLRQDGTTAIGIGIDHTGTGVLRLFRQDGACVMSVTLDDHENESVVKHTRQTPSA